MKEHQKLRREYIFQSERLGFRNWTENDLEEFAAINADLEVMEHFPNPLTKNESLELIQRLQNQYVNFGYTYFATEIPETSELIGFIGLAFQDYETDFTPAIDIGWRLKKSAWGKGYATEGAIKCLDFAFRNMKLDRVISTCTKQNSKSENVMKKIGMIKIGEFDHPRLKEYPAYERCLCYAINKNQTP